MSIISKSQLAHKGPAHDPLVCGISPETSCPGCRAILFAPQPGPKNPAWLQQWTRLRDFETIERGSRKLPPGRLPEALPPEEITSLAFTLCRPENRDPILAALAPGLVPLVLRIIEDALEKKTGRAG